MQKRRCGCFKMVLQIAVIGAGVIGSSTSLRLLQSYGEQCEVTLIAEKFSPDTTSDVATAIVLPFDVVPSSTGDSIDGSGNLEDWLKSTIEYVSSLYHSPEGGKMGIALVHGVVASNVEMAGEPWWSRYAYGYKDVTPEEQARLLVPPGFKTVKSFGAFVLDCRIYLPKILEKFRGLGGKTAQRKVSSLSELKADYDIVINCTGLGAASLVPDESVYPVRGDLVSVHAPWIKEFFIYHTDNGIVSAVPRAEDVLLGTTAIPTTFDDFQSSPKTVESIMKNCTAAMPNLACAKILTPLVGMRPMRSKVRLECDPSDNTVIHCYGHGSKGVCYHWGSAMEVDSLVKEILTQKKN